MTDSPNQVELGRPTVLNMLRTIKQMADLLPANASPADIAAVNAGQAMMAGLATVNALLAIETRLGELVAEQRTANALAILSHRRNLELDWQTEEAADEYLRAKLTALLEAAESGE